MNAPPADVTVVLLCDEDQCGEWFDYGNSTPDKARHCAAFFGWGRSGSRDFCPEHAARRGLEVRGVLPPEGER